MNNNVMEASEVFYVVGSITLTIITGLLAFLAYQIFLTLKAVQAAMSQAHNIAGNLRSVTTGVQFGFWAILSKVFGKFINGERR